MTNVPTAFATFQFKRVSMSDKFSISKHPIYTEAMTIYHKNVVKFALISLAFVLDF